MFLCRGRVNKQQVVIKQIPLDEMKNVERKAARNEVYIVYCTRYMCRDLYTYMYTYMYM